MPNDDYCLYILSFQNCACCEKDLKENKHNSLHLARNMLGYLSLDIICSSKITVFVELGFRKTVHLLEEIQTNILAYFRPKWPLFTCTLKVCSVHFNPRGLQSAFYLRSAVCSLGFTVHWSTEYETTYPFTFTSRLAAIEINLLFIDITACSKNKH